jgi:hypothetical protein
MVIYIEFGVTRLHDLESPQLKNDQLKQRLSIYVIATNESRETELIKKMKREVISSASTH